MTWVDPVPTPPTDTSRSLRDLLGAHADEYERGALAIARYWPAMRRGDVLTLKQLREKLRVLHAAVANLLEVVDPEADGVPYLVREALLMRGGERDPHGFLSNLHASLTTLSDSEAFAARQLPAPRKGNPGRPRNPGMDWLREQLLTLYADVTKQPRTSPTAAECAGLVLEWLGVSGTDVESLQKQVRRINKKHSE